MGANNIKSSSLDQSKYKTKNKKNEIDLAIFKTRVDCVIIKGLNRTKDDYILRSAKNLFKTNNFKEILLETKNTSNCLQELGIFSNVKVLIDTSKGEKASPNGYQIIFEGTELSRVIGSIGTTFDNNEGALSMELTSPNILGRGEQISVNGSYSTKKTNDVNLKLTKRYYHTVLGDYKPETSISLFKHTAFFPWSKYKLNSTGILFDFSSRLYKDVKQSIQYEMSVKDIFMIKKDVPFSIREQAGPKLSSLFRYILSWDERDSTIFPTYGMFMRSTNEINVYGNGGINFLSNNSHAEVNFPLFNGMSLQFVGRLGILYSKHNDKIPINNLFVLGGPLSIRGFRHAGIGPHDEGCNIGSQTYWSSGIHLWSPLPFANPNSKFSQLFKTHLFYNCGNTQKFTLQNIRSSCGAGLAIRMGERARIELNYCHPLQSAKYDYVEKGFQFGIGCEFL